MIKQTQQQKYDEQNRKRKEKKSKEQHKYSYKENLYETLFIKFMQHKPNAWYSETIRIKWSENQHERFFASFFSTAAHSVLHTHTDTPSIH